MDINFICSLGIFILFNVFTVSESQKLQCMDEKNTPVDWFILYKLPKLEAKSTVSSDGGTDDRGKKYFYMSSKTMRSNGWKAASKLISDLDSMPGNTLRPLYRKGKSDELWVLYNDQPPAGAKTKSTAGHTKGVVAANKNGGFWMVHSVPRYPETPAKEQYIYPDSGINNGQSYLCMSLGPKEIEKVATQLTFNEVGVYYQFISESLADVFPILTSVAKQTTGKLTTDKNKVDLKVGKFSFTSFAKSRKFNDDLYEGYVAPELHASLSVETWRNSPEPLKSDCTKDFSVMNVQSVNLCASAVCDRFSSTKDHSKWAVSDSRDNPWVCIGDINRAASQERRGGGTVCLNFAKVWDSFFNSVAVVEPCTRPKSPRDEIPPSVVVV